MSQAQRAIVFVVVVVLIVMLLWPPFHLVERQGAVAGRGFSFILSPPQEGATVDAALLAIELVVCLIVGGLLYLIVEKR